MMHNHSYYITFRSYFYHCHCFLPFCQPFFSIIFSQHDNHYLVLFFSLLLSLLSIFKTSDNSTFFLLYNSSSFLSFYPLSLTLIHTVTNVDIVCPSVEFQMVLKAEKQTLDRGRVSTLKQTFFSSRFSYLIKVKSIISIAVHLKCTYALLN